MKKKLERTPAFYVRRQKYGLYPLILIAFVAFLFAALGGGNTKADSQGKESGTGYLTTLPTAKSSPITSSKSAAQTEIKSLDKKKEELKSAQASLEDNFDFATLDKKGGASEKNSPPSSAPQKENAAGKKDTGYTASVPLLKSTLVPQGSRKTFRSSRPTAPNSAPSSNPISYQSVKENANASLDPAKERKTPLRTGFYNGTQAEASPQDGAPTTAIPKTISLRAMIHGSQTITQGDRVKLRLLESITLSGQSIPANTFLFAQSSFNGNRVSLVVHSIPIGGKLIPIEFKAYDLDGAPGIAAPDLEDNNLGNEAASEIPGAVSTGLGIIDRPISALVRKKTKKQITLPSDYTLILHHGDE